MTPSTASKQQAMFLNLYVLLFMLSIFLPRLFDTTAPYYRLLKYADLTVMTAMAAYILFLSVISWRKGTDKKTTLSFLLLLGQMLIIIGTVVFLFYKFW